MERVPGNYEKEEVRRKKKEKVLDDFSYAKTEN